MTESPPAAPRDMRTILRDARKAAGYSQHALAARLGWSQGRVAHVESGRVLPGTEATDSWAAATGMTEATRAELADLADEATRKSLSYRVLHRGGLAARMRSMREQDERTSLMREYQPGMLPGLLQPAGYARAVLHMVNTAGQLDVAQGAQLRVDRQQVLYNPAKRYQFVLAEAALRWHPPGPAAVMQAAAHHLVSVASLPNVTVGVIPATRPAPVLTVGGFTIFDSAMVMIEYLTGEQDIFDATEIGVYETAFGRLLDSVLTGQAAAELIRAVIPPA